MRIDITITDVELKQLVLDHISKKLGDVTFSKDDVKIEVKSKENYRAEWEEAAFRATLTRNGA